jgi:hypothetical protein
MKTIMKKTLVIGIGILFLAVTMMPAFSAIQQNTSKKNQESEYIQKPESQTDQLNQIIYRDTDTMQNELFRFTSMISTAGQDMDTIRDLINWLLNKSDYPLLSFLLSQLMNMERLQDRDIIVSAGWNYDINPLKRKEMDFLRPLTLWQYTDTSDMFQMPSTTILISSDPLKIETVFGTQLGYMFRFRGIYGHNPQKLPEKSFTYMIGTVQNAGVLELPNLAFNLFTD